MSVTLNLTPDVERKLQEKVAQNGQTLEEYLENLARQSAADAASPAPLSPSQLSADQWVAAWRAWVKGHPPFPVLADDSRESIYEGRGE